MVVETYSTVGNADKLRDDLLAQGCHIIREEHNVEIRNSNGTRIVVRRYSAEEMAYAKGLGPVEGERWLQNLQEYVPSC